MPKTPKIPKGAQELLADLCFTGFMREHWLRELHALGLSPDKAEAALGPVFVALHSVRRKHGIGAQAFWRALLRGHAAAATLAAVTTAPPHA